MSFDPDINFEIKRIRNFINASLVNQREYYSININFCNNRQRARRRRGNKTPEDKIFEQEHSQYENDLRRLQQERIRFYEDYQQSGILTSETQAKIERWYQNAVGQINRKAAASEEYRKSLEGADEGLQLIDFNAEVQSSIGLLSDENKIRQQLLQTLPQEGRDKVAAIQATKNLTAAQGNLIQATEQAARSFEQIEGDDQIVNQPAGTFEIIGGEEITTSLQQLDSAAQETATQLEELKQPVNDLQNIWSRCKIHFKN